MCSCLRFSARKGVLLAQRPWLWQLHYLGVGHAEVGCRGCNAEVRPGWWEGSRVLLGGCRGSPLPQRPAIRALQGWSGTREYTHPWRHQSMCSGSMGARSCPALQRIVYVPFQPDTGVGTAFSNSASCLSPGSPNHSMSGPGRRLWISRWPLLMLSGVFLVLLWAGVFIKTYPSTCLVLPQLPDEKPRVDGIRSGPQGCA